MTAPLRMNGEPDQTADLRRNHREMAAVARRAAEIIVERGKATGVYEDDHGRVCAFGAIQAARRELGSDLPFLILRRCHALSAVQALGLAYWSDLPTTTEAVIAKTFLQVADELEAHG